MLDEWCHFADWIFFSLSLFLSTVIYCHDRHKMNKRAGQNEKKKNKQLFCKWYWIDENNGRKGASFDSCCVILMKFINLCASKNAFWFFHPWLRFRPFPIYFYLIFTETNALWLWRQENSWQQKKLRCGGEKDKICRSTNNEINCSSFMILSIAQNIGR